ncbi:hypothetical protein GCM10009547_01410 [Sporichthya brevicatena]|uniref:Carboxymuconolactone decarboxylase-like domain-containing protein n=1 Tax=Sporichthya brevicatena TaxID=171442 RepID=A0ABP3R4M7_9ACTN
MSDEEFRHPSHSYLAEAAPEFFERYDAVVRMALALDGDEGLALPHKYRELIVICMLALLRAPEDAIANHIGRALGAGLSEAELVEGLQAAFVPGGAPVLMHGIRSLVRYREGA